MYTPVFPYTGPQAIITAERVTLLSSKDSVFVFGTTAVSLSSKGTINLDSNEKIIMSSPKIELGKDAEASGESVLLGDSLVNQLLLLIEELLSFSSDASKVEYSNVGSIESFLALPADKLAKNLPKIKNAIQNTVRSTTVFVQKNNS